MSIRPRGHFHYAVLLVLVGCVSNDVFWCVPKRHVWSRFGSTNEAAFRILIAADEIESPGLGSAGAPICLVTAYRQILSQHDAAAIFRRVFEQGTMSAKIYALAGLSETAPEVAAKLAWSLRDRDMLKLQRMDGCVGSQTTVAKLLAEIRDGHLQAMWRPSV